MGNRPHLVAGKIRIHCFMPRSDSILGDHFFIHRPENGIYRLGVVCGLGDPGPSVSDGELWPCAIAGAKFTTVSKATVAPASRVFISVLRDDSADSGIAVGLRARKIDRRSATRKFRDAPLGNKT